MARCFAKVNEQEIMELLEKHNTKNTVFALVVYELIDDSSSWYNS